MAIVQTIRSGSATVHIDDACCAGLSAEEAARRWAEVGRVILRIDRDHQIRQMAARKAEQIKE